MGSGLLYAGLLAVWAFVGVQFLLRRHEEHVEATSAERFSTAMRVLARRSSVDDGRWVKGRRGHVIAPREPSASETIDEVPAGAGRADEAQPAPTDGQWEPDLARVARTELATRRRRVLLTLVVATLLATCAAVVAPADVPWWAPLPLGGLCALYLVHLRGQVRRAAEVERRRRRAARRRLEGAQRRAGAVPAAGRRQAARPKPHPEPQSVRLLGASGAEAGTGTGHRDGGGSGRRVAEASAGTSDAAVGGSWEPVPVPLPTYVTKPKAGRSGRVIDLTTPGAWSSGRILAPESPSAPLIASPEAAELSGASGATTGAGESPGAPMPATDAPDSGLDDGEPMPVVEHRRAVGD